MTVRRQGRLSGEGLGMFIAGAGGRKQWESQGQVLSLEVKDLTPSDKVAVAGDDI